ncbi:molybdopterin-dependent oxidoreductase (plasmid) [Agrobacterium leguminum]|uniref:Anaerobic dehydrogenase, typically selenocysteine-containing n=1 Tax=Agrobacterium deltaense NCPPB 1641 TaxID=1183425 RepID=A0A1S7U9R7_9HYPH|nr:MULTISPECIES: molybdopterin-dependent oxidoreductase [Agrobacterium]WFS69625.1 molybdopterin-dependent oxidoreductase [Agrobacterium leguminum]CVI63607.1 Anaerobic dehydrogenase, typically selenocysteine-containing [Agrobacterium deltaense NCPPB 1641]
MIEEKVGFCTLCKSRCGTINLVENGWLKQVLPNPAHPTGKAMCPKGRSAPEVVHNSRRLTAPLRRTSPKGDPNPRWMEISWDDALDEIASRLKDQVDKGGPESVAFAVTSGSSSPLSDSTDWILRFIRGFGSPNLCYAAEICTWHKDYAHAFTFGSGIPAADYANSELILLWGHNPSNVWLAQAEAIAASHTRGAKLAVIDPRRTAFAGRADHWLRVRPGTDAAVAMGLARELIVNEAFDAEFVRDWTNATFLVRSDNGRFLRTCDVSRSDATEGYMVWEQETGAPVAAEGRPGSAALSGSYVVSTSAGDVVCRTAFDIYREAVERYDPETVERLTGVDAKTLTDLARAMGTANGISYHTWTGTGQHRNATQTERAIATLYALTGSFDVRGGNVQITPLPTPALHTMSMMPEKQRAKALGLKERPLGPALNGWITSTDLYDAIIDHAPYKVGALVTFGTNLLVSHPAPGRGKEALKNLDFYVHCDLFHNPTSDYADILLPVSTPWEYESLRIGFEISVEAQELVQLRQQMVPLQGDTRSDTWIVFELARRLGLGELFFNGDIEAAWKYQLAPLGLDIETLRANPQGIRIPTTQRYQKYRVSGFPTETGRAELYSEKLLRHGYSPVPEFVPSPESDDPSFPLVLMAASNGYFRHSQDRGMSALRRKRPEPLVEMHPDLASRHGIREGDMVRVATRTGSIVLKASFDEELAPDVVVGDYGWWESAPDLGLPGYSLDADGKGANYNALVPERDRDPISGSSPMRSLACSVELVSRSVSHSAREFRVSSRRVEANDIVSFEFEPVDGQALSGFLPGQHVAIRVGENERCYSLTGPGCEYPLSYSIAVRRIPDGSVSGQVTSVLKEGDIVTLKPPGGNFIVPVTNEFPLVLIAAGIGITPFMSLIESLTGKPGEPEVTLYYACRDVQSRAFHERLQYHARRLRNLTIINYLSRSGETTEDYRAGRFSVDDIPASLLRQRPRFYICASNEMMDELTAGLIARNVPKFEIFSERFRSPTRPAGDSSPACNIRFSRSGRTVRWESDSGVLLDFAERNGEKLPSGCRVGQCESCVVKILEGSVRHLIDDPELEEGMCLACQALPLSDLVIDA